ncbi:MAG TPA: response regulator, partial [Thermoanaerobaculia bacterium]
MSRIAETPERKLRTPPLEPGKPDERVSILAVDDDPQKLLALSALLSELDQEVVTAASGREALRHLLQREFAVILLDVRMPDMDGFETAALIRQRQSTEHTPIIFITSYGDETHATRGYSLGAVDYILAPVEPEVLKTKVLVFAELFRKTAQVRLQARSLERRAKQLLQLTQASLE